LVKLLSFSTLFIFTLLLIPSTNLRLNDTVVELQKMFGYDTPKQTNPRVFIWRYGADLIAKNPIFGFGVGDAKGELSVVLESCDAMFWNGERNIPIQDKNYNFHNQFMQTWAEVGIFGFLILVFIMIHPFLLKRSHPLFLIFIGLTFIGCLTESMFERQAGVVLFAFMYPLLFGLKKASDEY
jgi:O-antigen ligase